MSYVLGAALGVSTYVKKNSKVILFLLFAYLMVLFSFNTTNPDMATYQLQYYNKGFMVATEPVYNFISEIFIKLKLDYMFLRAFLGLVGLLLITITFYEFSPYPLVLLFLYAIYPFCIDAVQVRSFVAVSIVFFSIRFLIYYKLDKHKKNIVGFVVCILLATGFHYSSILFIILFLTLFDFRKHQLFYYVVVPSVIILSVMNLSSFLPFIEQVIGHRKAELWATGENKTTYMRIIRLIVSRFGYLIIAALFSLRKRERYPILNNRTALEHQTEENNDKYDIMNNVVIDKFLMLGSFYVFLYTMLDIYFAGDYERLSRLGVLMIILLISRYIYRVNKKNQLYMWFILYVYHILYFFSIMYGMTAAGKYYFDFVFRCIMENNPLYNNK